MPTDKIKWTSAQELAIDTIDRNVLVSASAGTGKTAVLSKRCANILSDRRNPTDASRILVVTFTEAAADEMTSRIAQHLRSTMAEKSSSYLRHQLLLLDAACISTIDSFCKRVITEHFYAVGIDPMFQIIAPDEQKLLKSELLDELIEQGWADAALSQGLEKLLQGRNTSAGTVGFLDRVIGLSEYLDTVAWTADFYERTEALAEVSDFLVSDIAGEQKKMLLSKLAQCKSQLRHSQALEAEITGPGPWSQQIEQDFIPLIDKCIGHLKAGDIAACTCVVLNSSMPNFKPKPKDLSPETADIIKAPAVRAKKTFKELTNLALMNPDYERIVNSTVNMQTKVLLELVKRFDRSYTETKRKLNRLDFADLEHLTLKLLTESDSIAQKLRARFDYIFVDEYQDINPLQQAIIEKLQRPNNVFGVGDVKQSIYAFRQAQPEIFLNRLKDSTAEAGALRVDLSDNFRSRKGILDFANAVFERIMTASVSCVDYDQEAFLRPAFDYKQLSDSNHSPVVELYITNDDHPKADTEDTIDEEDAEPEQKDPYSISSQQRQAAFIAERIKQMTGAAGGPALQIYDKQLDDYRDLQYRDIVILMRSPANAANDYVEVFTRAGIAVSTQSSCGYFAATEITDMVSLLKVLDNPRRDIEFAAVLRSPLFNITDSELAAIRLHSRDSNPDMRTGFYECVVNYSRSGGEKKLRQRLTEILDELNRWRIDGRRRSLADLIWKIYRSTGYLSFVLALPNGAQRRANLLKLHDRAIQFEGFATTSRSTSLTGFVEFIEKLLAGDQDWAPAQLQVYTENAVRIMSVHRSKGLEFSVVFLTELDRGFNFKGTHGDCLINDTDTIGLRIVEPVSKTRLPGIAHQVIADRKRDEIIAEEMRILYVAMTRARERLILCAAKKHSDCAAILGACAALPKEAPKTWQLKSAKCHFDWLLLGLGNRQKLYDLFGIDSKAEIAESDLFSAEILDRDRLSELAEAILDVSRKKVSAPTVPSSATLKRAAVLLDDFKSSLSWQYPFEDLTLLPAKTSVSELTHSDDAFAVIDFKNALQRLPRAVSIDRAEPSTGIDHRAVGSAAHLVIKNLPLTQGVTPSSVRGTVQSLVSAGLIPEALAGHIDIDSIAKFFQTELGALALDPANTVLREWPFTFARDAAELGAKTHGQIVVVQGIIDMLIKTPRGLVIIDFKTDRVTGDSVDVRAELYRLQISCYAQAAAKILKQKIAGAYLYFLHQARTVDV